MGDFQKQCSKCKQVKGRGDFAKKKTATDGLHNYCKPCKNKYNKNHYNNNKNYYKQKAKVAKKTSRKRYIDFKESLSCERCNMSFKGKPYLCDFHHKDGDNKVDNPSNLKLGSWDKFLAEVDKCKVLCSNCHREEHFGEKPKKYCSVHFAVMEKHGK